MKNEQMRIAIDGFRIVCERNTSGRAYALELIAALSERPEVQAIEILVPWANEELHSIVAKLPKTSVLSAAVSPFLDPARSWFRKTFWIQWTIPRLLGQRRTGLDWYIAPYHQCPVLLRTAKVLAVIHDLCGLREDCGYHRKSKGYWNHRFNFWTANRRADVLVPISEFAKTDFSAHYPGSAGKMVAPIYNSVKAKTLSTEAVSQALRGLNVHERFFIAFSATGPRKGTDITLKAYEAYRAQGGKSELVLIGGKAGINYWQGRPEARGLQGVRWLPDVPDLVRDALYQRAVALLFPSRCEGFGYPIVEALRQGCPSIALEYSPAKEILPKRSVFMQSLNSDELLKLMKDYDELALQKTESSIRELIAHSQKFADDSLGKNFVAALSR